MIVWQDRNETRNSTAIVNQVDYLQKLLFYLIPAIFTEGFVGNEKQLVFLVDLQKPITDFLKQLKIMKKNCFWYSL